jgi:hypothetical protein
VKKISVIRNANDVETKLAAIWAGRHGKEHSELLVRRAFVAGLRTGMRAVLNQLDGVKILDCGPCGSMKMTEILEITGRKSMKRYKVRCGSCHHDAWIT